MRGVGDAGPDDDALELDVIVGDEKRKRTSCEPVRLERAREDVIHALVGVTLAKKFRRAPFADGA